MNNQKLPSWLTIDVDCALIQLSRPATCNGVTLDRLRMRAPTVRDVRAAQKTAGGDEADRELQLFASLLEVGQKDLEELKLVDYQRLQIAYFRLVEDDGGFAGAAA